MIHKIRYLAVLPRIKWSAKHRTGKNVVEWWSDNSAEWRQVMAVWLTGYIFFIDLLWGIFCSVRTIRTTAHHHTTIICRLSEESPLRHPPQKMGKSSKNFLKPKKTLLPISTPISSQNRIHPRYFFNRRLSEKPKKCFGEGRKKLKKLIAMNKFNCEQPELQGGS